MHKGHRVRGTVEGTGSAINIELGFTPAEVWLFNIDGDAWAVWTKDMDDDEAYKTVAAGTNAQIASGGITPYDGSAADENAGFTIGDDSDLNVEDETIIYIAVGGEDA